MMPSPPRKSGLQTLLLSLLASAALGADYTWQTAGTNNNWSTAAGDTNWFISPDTTTLAAWANASHNAIFAGATGETITINGTITPTSTTINDNGSWTFANGTSGAINGGTLVKNGTGILTIGLLANGFTATTINGGTISIGTGGTAANTSTVTALGTGTVTINNTGTLRLWIKNDAAFTLTNNLVIDGGTLRNEDGNHTMSGTILVNAGGANFTTQWDTKNLTLSGVISGAGAVRIATANQASSRVIMTATNTYSGGTTVTSGTLQLGNSTGGDQGGNGVIRGAITVNSGATLSLNINNAFGYTNGTKVDTVNLNGGTLTHAANGDNGWGITYNLTGALMQTTGGGRFSFGGNSGGTGTAVNTLASANSSVISGLIRIRENNVNNSVVFNIADGGAVNDLIVHANIEQGSTGYGITKTGAGLMLLNGANTYTGSTIINGGTLSLTGIGTLASSPVEINSTGTFRLDSTGKTLASITANNGSTIVLGARTGATTTLTGALTLTDAAAITLAPVFSGSPATAGSTYDLITAASITGTGTVSTNFNYFGQSHITGSTTVVGNVLRLTLATGAANLVWNNASANGQWDINTSANFNNGGSNDVFMSYDAVTFDDTTAPGTAKAVNLVGTVAPALLTVNNTTGNDYTFNATSVGSGQLVGAGSLVKNGTGTLTLGTNLTYNMTGDITVNAGTFSLGSKALVNVASVILNGGTLSTGSIYATSFDLRSGTASTVLTGTGSVTKSTAGTVTLSGVNNYTGTTTVSGGTLILTGNNTTTGAVAVNAGILQVGSGSTSGSLGSGAVSIASGATVLYNRSDSPGIANVFSGAGALNFNGTNNGISNGASGYSLSGNNSTFSGTMAISNARLTVDNTADIGTAAINIGTNGQFYFSAGGTYTNNLTISGNGWGESVGVLGAIRLAGNVNLAGSITLAGNARITAYGNSGTISGAIGDGGNNFGVTFGAVASTSNITLSGASTYTGATSISSLAANQGTTVTLTGSLGNTAVTVSNFSTLAGEGTIGTIAGSASLTHEAGSFLNADLSTTAALTVNGTVNVSGATTLNLTSLAGITPGSSYTILNHTGALTGLANLILPNAATYRAALITDTGSALQVSLGNKAVTWTGAASGSWDIGTAINWVDGSSIAERFFQADAVTFVDGAANTSITVTGALTPSSVTFNNSTATYTITTSTGNTIGGASVLTKTNTGTVNLSGPNTYTGGTLVRQGTLVGLNATAFGTGTITLGDAGTAAGTLALYLDPMTAGANITASNAINVGPVSAATTAVIGTLGSTATQVTRSANFSGAITLNDDVILRSGAHDSTTFSGAITGGSGFTISVENGLIAPSNATAQQFGAGQAGNRIILSGDTNGFTGNWNIRSGSSSNLTIFQINTGERINNNSNVNIEEFAVFRLNSAETINALTGNGRVRAVSARLLTVGAGNGSGTFSGVLENDTFDAGTLSFAKSGTGTQILTGTNTYTGTTAVNGGVLQVGDGGTTGTLGGTGAITVSSGATLTYNRSDLVTLDRAFTNSGGNLIKDGAGNMTIASFLLLPTNFIVNSGVVTINGGSFGGNRMEGNGTLTINAGASVILTATHTLGGGNGSMSDSVVVNGGLLTLNEEQYFNNLTLQNGGNVNGIDEVRASSATNWQVTGSSATASEISTLVSHVAAANWTVQDITANSETDLIISGRITNTGALNKGGAGTMELSNDANSYSGGTSINAGTLLVNTLTGSATGTGQVTIAAGATLAGRGAINTTNANITINGTLRVGNLGDDLFTSDLNLHLGTGTGTVLLNGVLLLDIFGQEDDTMGSDHGQLYSDVLKFNNTGAVQLGGTLKVEDAAGDALNWNLGDSWQLIDWANVTAGGITGTFATYELPTLAAGLKWDTSLIGQTGYISVIAIPEPSRAMLLLMAGAGFLLRKRRKQGLGR
ncbi:autotransporter-associated beta strand repeat-containing protein [Verrucomicrobium sp. BvORR034]|uniref:beta strand repeat-containing protein n=1 Tax=Verrucomicrobium sp. BvORR034 TaxID=1396418 RepID=UPI000678AF1E|nr:autotransporter-associated beta strand repeat-containing protein [Verrucomicrobium sp. BvORR034]